MQTVDNLNGPEQPRTKGDTVTSKLTNAEWEQVNQRCGHDLMDVVMRLLHGTATASETLDRLGERMEAVAEIAANPFIPGEYKCPECGFVLVRSLINYQTGAVTADTSSERPACPNDGKAMDPVRMEEALNEARSKAMKVFIATNHLIQTHNLLMQTYPATYPTSEQGKANAKALAVLRD